MNSDFLHTRLKDATPVFIRRVHPYDGPIIENGFHRLSEKTRYYRFLSPVSRLPAEHLNRLLHCDHINHEVLCAGMVHDRRIEGVGLGQYIRSSQNPAEAEFAIVIVDDYQTRGLGGILVHALIRSCRRNGIKKIFGYYFAENHRFHALAQKYHADIRLESGAVLRADIHLTE